MTNKQKLIALARSGALRPNSEKTRLGLCFIHFVNPKHKKFDYRFYKEMKEIAPHWFYYQTQVGKRKEKILHHISNGIPVDQMSKKLFSCFRNQRKVDPYFKAQILRVAPKGFSLRKKRHRTISNRTKGILLQLARDGFPRPDNNPKLRRFLYNYMCESNKNFDPLFKSQMLALAPQWFPRIIKLGTRNYNPEAHKKELINLAISGAKRPVHGMREYSRFKSYVNPHSLSFDPDFRENIRVVAPGWLKRAKRGPNKPRVKV